MKDLKNTLGDLFYFSLGQGEEPFAGAKETVQNVSSGFLAQLSRKINKIIEEVKFSDNALVSAEVGMFTVMDSCLDIDSFIRRLEALERGEPASSGPASPARPPLSQAPAQATPAARTAKPSVQKAVPVSPKPAVAAKPAVNTQEDILADDEEEEDASLSPAAAASLQKTLSNRQIWDKMLQQFAKSPFVYDVMTNCSVTFSDAQWTLHFAPGKEFYQIPAQNKLPELEQAAQKISGRVIRIQLGTPEQPSAAQTAPRTESVKKPSAQAAKQPAKAAPYQEPAPVRGTAPHAAETASQKQSAPAGSSRAVISEEEPFVKGNFEADAAAVAAADTPEEVKDILEIFPGELMA